MIEPLWNFIIGITRIIIVPVSMGLGMRTGCGIDCISLGLVPPLVTHSE